MSRCGQPHCCSRALALLRPRRTRPLLAKYARGRDDGFRQWDADDGWPRSHGYDGMMGMADHVEGRIAFLKVELKITDAQMPQWNAFAMHYGRTLAV